jgi:heat shock protein HslJ
MTRTTPGSHRPSRHVRASVRAALPALIAALTGLALVGPAAAEETSPSSSLAPVPSAASEASPVAGPEASPGMAPVDLRPEGPWRVTALDGSGDGLVDVLAGSPLTLWLLPDGRLEGETACGAYVGGYALDGSAITAGVMATGAESCGTRRREETSRLVQALLEVTRWQPGTGELLLLDAEGRVRVTLAELADASPVGDWLVRREVGRDGRLVELPAGEELALALDAAGTVAGSTGCRAFTGGYRVEVVRILIAPITLVGLPCEGPDERSRRRQERRLLDLFDQVVEWQRSGTRLELLDAQGAVLLELEARAAVAPSPAPDRAGEGSAAPGQPAMSGAPGGATATPAAGLPQG